MRDNRVFWAGFTLVGLPYCAAFALMWWPERFDGSLGRLEIFQPVAGGGSILSFGSLGYRLVDWYQSCAPYTSYLARSLAALTPLYFACVVCLGLLSGFGTPMDRTQNLEQA